MWRRSACGDALRYSPLSEHDPVQMIIFMLKDPSKETVEGLHVDFSIAIDVLGGEGEVAVDHALHSRHAHASFGSWYFRL